MKKSVLALGLVFGCSGLVPLISQAQTQPDAKAEAAAKPAAKPAPAPAQKSAAKPVEKPPMQLADDAPTSYTVVKGDTLWDISARFLKEPWRWPEIWNMNREQIKDPHWIYPGDTINLSFDASGKPMLSVGAGGKFDGSAVGSTVKLSPQVRLDAKALAIPSIPSRAIGPFLTLPLVVDAGALDNSPKIVATEDGRVIVGAGNIAYATGMGAKQGTKWQVYRPGAALVDPVTKEVLGHEASYLGDARVTKFGEVTTLEIVKSTQEINRGDRLTPTVESTLPSFSPRAPEKTVQGAIVSVRGGLDDAAQYSVVSINLGKKDGIEIGHVLGVLQKGETVSTKDEGEPGLASRLGISGWFPSNPDSAGKDGSQVASEVKLPDERNGLMFVFRVFDRVSFALVMSSRRQIKVGDVVQTP
jgi:LysM domain